MANLVWSVPHSALHRPVRPGTSSSSLAELLEFFRDRAGLELVTGAKGVLAGRLARHTAEDHAVEQGVAAQTVVAVDASGSLASNVEAGDHSSCLRDALGIHGALQ